MRWLKYKINRIWLLPDWKSKINFMGTIVSLIKRKYKGFGKESDEFRSVYLFYMLCNKFLRTLQFKSLYYHTVSMDQQSGHGFAGN